MDNSKKIEILDLAEHGDIRGINLCVQQNGGEYMGLTTIMFDETIDSIQFLDKDGKVCTLTLFP